MVSLLCFERMFMPDLMQRNAANILAISMILLSGSATALPARQTSANDHKGPSDQPILKEKNNLNEKK